LRGPKQNPDSSLIRNTICEHLEQLYRFYGDLAGVRIARKHITWYLGNLMSISQESRNALNAAILPAEQLQLMNSALDLLA
jgi:tRNA-dihydrouridine synthase B